STGGARCSIARAGPASSTASSPSTSASTPGSGWEDSGGRRRAPRPRPRRARLFVPDHVSSHTGFGMEGLVRAATLAALEPELAVHIGVYLLALRHPVPVARQIATLCESAPGRLLLGVGGGGEDRREIEICGADPETGGRRTD